MRRQLGAFFILLGSFGLGSPCAAQWAIEHRWTNDVVTSQASVDVVDGALILDGPRWGASFSQPWIRVGPMVFDIEFRRLLQPKSLTSSALALPGFPRTMPFTDYQGSKWGGVLSIPELVHLGLLGDFNSPDSLTGFFLGQGKKSIGKQQTSLEFLGGVIFFPQTDAALGIGLGISKGGMGPWFGWVGGGFNPTETWWSAMGGGPLASSGEFVILYQGSKRDDDNPWTIEGRGQNTIEIEAKKLQGSGGVEVQRAETDLTLEARGKVEYVETREPGRLQVSAEVVAFSLPLQTSDISGAGFRELEYRLGTKIEVSTVSLESAFQLDVEGGLGQIPRVENRKITHTIKVGLPRVEVSFLVNIDFLKPKEPAYKGQLTLKYEKELPGGTLRWEATLEQLDFLEADWYRGMTPAAYLRGPAMRLTELRGQVSFKASPRPE